MNTSNNGICPASADFRTGRSTWAWYSTMMPFEHFDSWRSQVFPNSCNVQQLVGSGAVKVKTRTAKGHYPSPYNLMTRERDELFVYGGYVNQEGGAYVAKLDPVTLREKWRVHLVSQNPDQFDWPGVAGVHGNGFIYAVAGNILAQIDPDTCNHRKIYLPEHPEGGGAAYNGFVISREGFLITKSLERGTNTGQSLLGLREVAANGVPAILVAVDPNSLEIVAQAEVPEPILGRVMIASHSEGEYVYLPGLSKLWRYRFTRNAFILDETWNPVYAQAGESPGTACGMLGPWVIIQTNFLRSDQPLRISAFFIDDARRCYSILPFPDGSPSQEFSKPALDSANMRIYTNDQAAGLVAGIDFDPMTGFQVAWRHKQDMASFWAVVGPEGGRNIIGTNFNSLQGDRVLWRNAETGDELACSDVLDSKFNGNIVSTGFDGCFYYLAAGSGKVVELRLESAPA